MTLLEEDDGGPRALALELADDVPPLAGVRRWAGDALGDLTDDEVGDCLLVVTELVANAYDHGEAPRRVRLHRSDEPCSVRIEVDDAAPGEVVVGRSRLGHNRGRGMVLVANLSARWGVDRHEAGKTVWAEVLCSYPSSGSGT
ncbi:ATP-binding protein [Saccharothrix texasensis]|uniref:Anti-sigma regulatory factor (Ser/Thr protein kinase) n=1 Tax=Saccharothrix texasensis TaxID=103734 RepID=A0A3N1HHI1_9PSEU|nr:ATP-binding protein [Saccharothrix texasensis]ROP41772.1 anti-sigma regulatory factor (Ser/Thr protein kinase) [Saccharothrix texasensis]